MNYCLSSRQLDDKLCKPQVTEIKFNYEDRKAIVDFFDKYPDKNFILVLNENPDWEEIIIINNSIQKKLILCARTISQCKEAGKNNIQFYWGYNITTYRELANFKNLGACYAKISGPLFFDLERVKNMEIPIRTVPNVAIDDDLPEENGIYGTWIRPEEVNFYEDYIEVFEFEDCNTYKESLLFKIYDKKEWTGDLSDLITNLNFKADNLFIYPDSSRLTCGQRCKPYGFGCNLCYHRLNLANAKKIINYLDSQK